MPAPGSGDLFLDFKGPLVVNQSGAVLTGANLANGSGLFVHQPGGVQLVADTFSQPPGTEAGTTFFNSASFFTDRGLTSRGDVIFRASLSGTAINQENNSGLWSMADGTPQYLARESGPSPLGGGVTFSWTSADLYFQPVVSTAGGNVVFAASLEGVGVTSDNSNALFLGTPEAVEVVVRQGDPAVAPGLPANARHGPSGVRPMGLNDSGQVIFVSALSGTGINSSNDLSIWKGTAGNLEMILREGQQIPGAPDNVRFSSTAFSQLARGIALNSAGESVIYMVLAGLGVTTSDDTALFTDVGGTPGFIVREGDAAPGLPGVSIASLTLRPFMINGRGDVALYLQLSGTGITSSNNEALYFWTLEHGLQLVFQKGSATVFESGTFTTAQSQMPNYTVGDDQAAGLTFNNRGQLVLATTLGSNRHIIRATLIRPATYQWSVTGATTGQPQAASANYRTDTSGESLAGQAWASADYLVKTGYAGQLADVMGVETSLQGSAVAEAGGVQASALLRLDDDTFLAPEPGSLSWHVMEGPLESVTSGGLLLTGVVYQTESAWLRVRHALGFGDAKFTVLDSDDDNYGAYAGDDLPDHWQVMHFGLPPNALAHPGADPDFNGHNNFFEFLAGTDPKDPTSFFRANIVAYGGDGFSIIINQAIPGTRYRVFRSQNLEGWTEFTEFTVSTPQTEVEVQDTSPLPGRGFYRVTLEKATP